MEKITIYRYIASTRPMDSHDLLNRYGRYRRARNEKELEQKMEYIYWNPVKDGLVEDPEQYYGWFVNTQMILRDRIDRNWTDKNVCPTWNDLTGRNACPTANDLTDRNVCPTGY